MCAKVTSTTTQEPNNSAEQQEWPAPQEDFSAGFSDCEASHGLCQLLQRIRQFLKRTVVAGATRHFTFLPGLGRHRKKNSAPDGFWEGG
jgi:hypothetical protein